MSKKNKRPDKQPKPDQPDHFESTNPYIPISDRGLVVAGLAAFGVASAMALAPFFANAPEKVEKPNQKPVAKAKAAPKPRPKEWDVDFEKLPTTAGLRDVKQLFPHDVVDLYIQWLSICVEKKLEADEMKRPFYIVMGEKHGSPECSLYEVLLTDIAFRLGIQNKMLEADQTRYDAVKEREKTPEFYQKFLGSMVLLIAYSDNRRRI